MLKPNRALQDTGNARLSFFFITLVLFAGYKASITLRAVFFVPIFYGFCMSGSRTVWMALVMVLGFYCLTEIRSVDLELIAGLGVGLFLLFCGGMYFMVMGEFYAPERMLNFDSALIRFERYFEFVQGSDLTYFLADSDGARLGLVSESAYFTLMNSMGLLGFMCFLVFLVFIFKARLDSEIDTSFKMVFLYCLVCAFFKNTLNSFPNNQLSLVSMGVFFVFRESRENKKRG
ncbi:hypothetical protein [Pseudomonas sp. St316]|uniref:hypothetical protein n=1 Tax=Pseudomonas sp. St316 TaxID=2678257 RepID=UPI001BB328DE|nr:hypothetical protein [Pseudomonas sp. St316]BBP60729.1 hypothetical protein PHLH4_43190 [Pseudomonas sp. St316]